MRRLSETFLQLIEADPVFTDPPPFSNALGFTGAASKTDDALLAVSPCERAAVAREIRSKAVILPRTKAPAVPALSITALQQPNRQLL
jgi:hypothetical protein